MAVGKKTNYCSPLKRKHANGPKRETLPLSASTKRYHQAQAPNASSNGGDASRVGKIAMCTH